LNSNLRTNDLHRIILKVIKEKNPQSFKQLTKLLKENGNLTEEEIVKSVLKLQAEGVIKFRSQAQQSWGLSTYLKTSEAVWYWLIIIVGATTAGLAFTISESVYPWIYARNALGVIFVLFLPGYSFLKAFLQSHMSAETSTRSLESIEFIALSIGLSIALVSLVGLLLYYSSLGLNLTNIVLSLFAFSLFFATAAVIREYQAKQRQLTEKTIAIA
jgi:hypothetical protein